MHRSGRLLLYMPKADNTGAMTVSCPVRYEMIYVCVCMWVLNWDLKKRRFSLGILAQRLWDALQSEHIQYIVTVIGRHIHSSFHYRSSNSTPHWRKDTAKGSMRSCRRHDRCSARSRIDPPPPSQYWFMKGFHDEGKYRMLHTIICSSSFLCRQVAADSPAHGSDCPWQRFGTVLSTNSGMDCRLNIHPSRQRRQLLSY